MPARDLIPPRSYYCREAGDQAFEASDLRDYLIAKAESLTDAESAEAVMDVVYELFPRATAES